MGRKRVIDTDELLFDEELFEAVGVDGLWLYVRLWSIAEDFGGYEPNYGSISLKTGVLKLSKSYVNQTIEKFIKLGKVVTYCINGKTYHWLRNLLKHQRLNNPAPPTLPLPPWVTCEIRQYQSKKKYASYEIDWEILASHTSSLLVADFSLLGVLETETKRNETETETITPIVPLQGTVFSVQALAELWNSKAPPELSRVHLPFKRPPREMQRVRDSLKRNPDMKWWESVIFKMHDSPFLRGMSERGWKASFDFMVKKAEEILDGKYDQGKGPAPTGFTAVRNFMAKGEGNE
jgi:hypothetical protein